MRSSVAQIGFDRFIALDWMAAAIRHRAGLAPASDLATLIDAAIAGTVAQKKTRTVLNRLCLDPRPQLSGFIDRGVAMYRDAPDVAMAALPWGMALVTYPFFGRVTEVVGRLVDLHGGKCSATEVHRRMRETHGDREGTRRMTNAVLQSLSSWGTLRRVDGGHRIVRTAPVRLNAPPVAEWMVEACLRHAGRAMSVTSVRRHPSMFPFELDSSISYTLSRSSFLSMHVDGSGDVVVDLACHVGEPTSNRTSRPQA